MAWLERWKFCMALGLPELGDVRRLNATEAVGGGDGRLRGVYRRMVRAAHELNWGAGILLPARPVRLEVPMCCTPSHTSLPSQGSYFTLARSLCQSATTITSEGGRGSYLLAINIGNMPTRRSWIQLQADCQRTRVQKSGS